MDASATQDCTASSWVLGRWSRSAKEVNPSRLLGVGTPPVIDYAFAPDADGGEAGEGLGVW